MLRKLGFFLLFFCGSLSCVSSQVFATDMNIPHIRVTGQAELSVVPDKLQFTIYLREQGRSVSKLYASINQKAQLIVSYLSKQKIAPKNVTSMAIQVTPWFEYENQSRTQKGFELTRNITVVLPDTQKLGVILDHLFRIGNLEIGSVNLMVSDLQQQYLKALSGAVDSARGKAKILADELSLTLGDALIVKELSSQTLPQQDSFRLSEGVPGNFLPGEIAIQASVEVTFGVR